MIRVRLYVELSVILKEAANQIRKLVTERNRNTERTRNKLNKPRPDVSRKQMEVVGNDFLKLERGEEEWRRGKGERKQRKQRKKETEFISSGWIKSVENHRPVHLPARNGGLLITRGTNPRS